MNGDFLKIELNIVFKFNFYIIFNVVPKGIFCLSFLFLIVFLKGLSYHLFCFSVLKEAGGVRAEGSDLKAARPKSSSESQR